MGSEMCIRDRNGVWGSRMLFDVLFWILVVIVLLNIIFGLIIDTFAMLRSSFDQPYLIPI